MTVPIDEETQALVRLGVTYEGRSAWLTVDELPRGLLREGPSPQALL